MKRLVVLVWICCACSLHAQYYAPAIALPLDSITLDGDFEDWPSSFKEYPIARTFDGSHLNPMDFSATFKVGYNLRTQSVYLAVTVTDDDHVAMTPEEQNGLEDYVLVYVDGKHSRKGNNMVRFVASQHHRSIEKQNAQLDPINRGLSWDSTFVKVRRDGQQTFYEWQINMGELLKEGKPLGLDFFIEDVDTNEEDSSLLVWSPGYGKSRNAILLGEVIPVSTKQPLGTIQGAISIRDTLFADFQPTLVLTSTKDPAIWFRTVVDKDGNYEVTLPVGNYEAALLNPLTADLFVDDFNVRPKRWQMTKVVPFEVVEGEKLVLPPMNLTTQSLPTDLYGAKGLLHESSMNTNRMDAFLETYQEYFNIPGISLALIKDGKVVYHKVRGVKNTVTQEPLTKKTVFEAASITKPVFSMIVMRLAERGLIDLDKPLYEYLPFPNLEKDDRYRLITARIVLNHRTGLPNWAFWPPGSAEEGGDLNLLFSPGDRFRYSGEGMNYLGRVVAHITGKSVSELFKEEIAGPFGLQNTFFTFYESIADASRGHYQDLPRYKQRTTVDSPASSMWTEASDFSKFVIGLMNESHLSKEGYQSIYTPQHQMLDTDKLYDPSLPQGVANGFFVQDTPYGKVLAHGGNNVDFECKFAYVKGKKMGYIVFTNNNLGDEFIRLLELFLFRGNLDDY